MLELHVVFSDQTDAYKANTEICEFFKGLSAFVNDDIFVTVIKKEQAKVSSDSFKELWAFDICFMDSTLDRRVVISAGEIGVKGIKTLWAFNKVENYVCGEDNS